MAGKPRSMYLDVYLRDAAQRVARGERPLTPGTFLSYQLRGWARTHEYQYRRPLLRALEAEVEAGRVVAVRSARGGVGYAPRVVAA